jgi:hypothetical protein
MSTLQEPTHILIFLLLPIGLANLISLIVIPILAAKNFGIWWKWLLLTWAIGPFAWIPLIVFLNQRKKVILDAD